MKENKLIRIFILFLSLVTITSCKKEKLTKETQVGANTFSCKINGVVHIPNNEAFSVEAISLILYTNAEPGYFDLSLLTNYSREKPSEKIYIILSKIKQVGVYKLSSNELRYGTYILNVQNNSTGRFGVTYDSKAFNKGEVNITKLDRENKIISGTFWFEATNENDPNDKVTVTEGRFDLKI